MARLTVLSKTAKWRTSVLMASGSAAAARIAVSSETGCTTWERGECEGLLGINLEGPYLNRLRCGAQPAGQIRRPDREELAGLLDHAGGCLKIMTLAPEVEGGIGLIRLLTERGVIPAIGHSNAGLEEAREAFAGGAAYVTHLFNAMSGLRHRNPGLAAAGGERIPPCSRERETCAGNRECE